MEGVKAAAAPAVAIMAPIKLRRSCITMLVPSLDFEEARIPNRCAGFASALGRAPRQSLGEFLNRNT
jgi:hypothetical protein